MHKYFLIKTFFIFYQSLNRHQAKDLSDEKGKLEIKNE